MSIDEINSIYGNQYDQDKKEDNQTRLEELRCTLLASPLLFTQTFYKIRTGRDFIISHPEYTESHFITICKLLKKVFSGEINKLIINIPPRYGKTEMMINFIAWSLARYPDSNFLYISYAKSLSCKQTQTVREIMQLPQYQMLFNVPLSDVTGAKHDFETAKGGSVYAAGLDGAICGRGAGVRGVNRFGGVAVIDDIHKPEEIESDTIRNGVIDWFYGTMQSRLNNGEKTPMIYIGQRLREGDLADHLIKRGDWTLCSLPANDLEFKHALYPELHSIEYLREYNKLKEYVYASQFLQNPQPPGGGLWKKKHFPLLEEEPEILSTFIVGDTAETAKTYNDATVFTFFGLYKMKSLSDLIDTGTYGLIILDCLQIRVEPMDLEDAFLMFVKKCLGHKVKLSAVAIEKKSTGSTLLSIIKNKLPGIEIIPIERNASSGSKSNRFIQCQPFIAKGQVAFPKFASHVEMCLEHCSKITPSSSHDHDDIADTIADGIKLALMDNVIAVRFVKQYSINQNAIANDFMTRINRLNQLRRGRNAR